MLSFANKLLTWYDQHGRKDLPWQQPRSPYQVWISEIMLQQTQVATVIPYFQRFMQSFPTVSALAEATTDHVLQHWSGLGYYARGRNLHKAAQFIVDELHGEFPTTRDAWQALPGIGRSTAAAICAQAFNLPEAILDGNVKRVLARYHAVEGWPGDKAVENKLWIHAEKYVPQARVADYTQALMDLGAVVCRRSKPQCTACPLQKSCIANKENLTSDLPHRKPRKALPIKTTNMLVLCLKDNRVLLEKRPPVGIWGGLWSFPESQDRESLAKYCQQNFAVAVKSTKSLASFRHTFSHFHLDITPILLHIDTKPKQIMDSDSYLWYNLNEPANFGLAAPMQKILQDLENNIHDTYDSMSEITD